MMTDVRRIIQGQVPWMHVARYGLKRLRDNRRKIKTLKTFSSKIAALVDMKPFWEHDKIFF